MNELNEILDSIYTLTQKRDMMVDAYNTNIDKLKALLDSKMKAAGTDHLEFNGAIAFYRGQTTAEIGDWNALMEFVQKYNAFDILQRRVAPAPLEKRLKAGAKIKDAKITRSSVLIVQGKKDASSE